MLHVGLDLSRTRPDVHVMDQSGTSVAVTTAAPDVGGSTSLAYRLGELGQPVTAVIESMNGARFIHDQLELRGWTVHRPVVRIGAGRVLRGTCWRRRQRRSLDPRPGPHGSGGRQRGPPRPGIGRGQGRTCRTPLARMRGFFLKKKKTCN